jgi:hypothetical protein
VPGGQRAPPPDARGHDLTSRLDRESAPPDEEGVRRDLPFLEHTFRHSLAAPAWAIEGSHAMQRSARLLFDAELRAGTVEPAALERSEVVRALVSRPVPAGLSRLSSAWPCAAGA